MRDADGNSLETNPTHVNTKEMTNSTVKRSALILAVQAEMGANARK